MINILIIFLLPFLLPGLISRVKAIMVGRKGQSIFQQYYHFFKLIRKDEVISHSASFITRVAPLLALAGTLVAALFVPMGTSKAILSFKGDFILVLYMLALTKGIMVFGALDSSSSFEGMGASRELSFTAFLEPAFVLIVASLVHLNGFSSLSGLFSLNVIDKSAVWSLVVAGLMVLALYIMLLVESCRVPFDDPATHLELTMIHEVMVLDYSGFSLGLIHYTAALKMLIYASFITQILMPSLSGISFFVLYLSLVILIAILTGILESLIARFRMIRNLELVLVPVSISLLAIAALIAGSIGVW